MKSLICHFAIAVAYLTVASPDAGASWSEFADVNSLNESKYGIKVEVAARKNQQHIYRIKAPMVGGHKRCWLIVCKKKLAPKQQNFRNYIWTGESKKSDVLLKAQLTPEKGTDVQFSLHKDLFAPPKESYIEFTLHKDLVSRSYVYIDFPRLVFDGGYYYAIDLASYLKKDE
jgi:hypothetical protein